MGKNESSRGPGRPPRPMPDRIPATPEEVVRVLVTTPPKKEGKPPRDSA